jgi:fluoride exporter
VATPESIDPDLEPDAETTLPSDRRPGIDVRVALVVFFGGVFGGLARYAIGQGWRLPASAFPWNTFVVNVSGAFALAVLIVVLAARVPHLRYLRPALGTGFLGAYTTFSSLAVSTDRLIAHGHAMTGVAYVVISTVAGLAAAVAGWALGHRVAPAVAS